MKHEGPTPIANVRIGDQVRSSLDNNDTSAIYSRVYCLAHKSDSVEMDYVQLYFRKTVAPPLEISRDHLLLLDNSHGSQKSIPAGDVKEGTVLAGGQIVESVSTVQRRGAYAPLTESGMLVTNGHVLASSYIQIVEPSGCYPVDGHELAHAVVGFRRLYCRWVMNCHVHETHDPEHGLAVWILPVLTLSHQIAQAPALVRFGMANFMFPLVINMGVIATTLLVMFAGSVVWARRRGGGTKAHC